MQCEGGNRPIPARGHTAAWLVPGHLKTRFLWENPLFWGGKTHKSRASRLGHERTARGGLLRLSPQAAHVGMQWDAWSSDVRHEQPSCWGILTH